MECTKKKNLLKKVIKEGECPAPEELPDDLRGLCDLNQCGDEDARCPGEKESSVESLHCTMD